MSIPVLKSTIGRRLLVNFRADAEAIRSKLPLPFRPKLHGGNAIVGVCLIRLEHIRPAFLPPFIGASSENAAHRIAVLWEDEAGTTQEGVYIPRRDTSSVFNHLAGGRLFPGQHQLASFEVQTTESQIDFQMRSRDNKVEIRVAGQVAPELPASSCFSSLAEASSFFESGSLGYSARYDSSQLDGVRMLTHTWQVEALDISEVYSSYYADEDEFPKGSIIYDHTLLMKNRQLTMSGAPSMSGAPQ
jgi:hypothetical protein